MMFNMQNLCLLTLTMQSQILGFLRAFEDCSAIFISAIFRYWNVDRCFVRMHCFSSKIFVLCKYSRNPITCWTLKANKKQLIARVRASSETQGQSVGSGENARRKFSSKGGRAPGYRLSPDHFQKFKRMPAPDWAQKVLCIIVPNRRTVSP